MTDRPQPEPAATLIESQRTYYELRADDYGNTSKPDRQVRKGGGLVESELLGRSIIDEFRPTGNVLELACGPGVYTADLARWADAVTAVDASPRMIARARSRVGDPKVTYVQADIFEWRPEVSYDVVFFGAWLSHVPPSVFDAFWSLVRTCLAPQGRVLFIDEDDRAAVNDDLRSMSGVPTARRTLSDGRQFDIVKVFWRPDDLEDRLRSSGWDVRVRPVGEAFLYGVGATDSSG
jgi:SAM-dependent methyltransferase